MHRCDDNDFEAPDGEHSLEPWHPSLAIKTPHTLTLNSSFKFFSCLSLCSLRPIGPELLVMHTIPCVLSLCLSLDSPGALGLDCPFPTLQIQNLLTRQGLVQRLSIILSDFYYVYPHLAVISPFSEQPGLFSFFFLFLIMFGLISSLTSCSIRAGAVLHFFQQMSS